MTIHEKIKKNQLEYIIDGDTIYYFKYSMPFKIKCFINSRNEYIEALGYKIKGEWYWQHLLNRDVRFVNILRNHLYELCKNEEENLITFYLKQKIKREELVQ